MVDMPPNLFIWIEYYTVKISDKKVVSNNNYWNNLSWTKNCNKHVTTAISS